MVTSAMATDDFAPLKQDQGISPSVDGARQSSSRSCRMAGLLAGVGALMLLGVFNWVFSSLPKANYGKQLSLVAQANVTESLGLNFVSKGPHTVCRHYSPEEQHTNRDGRGKIPIITSNGLEDCKQKCRDRKDCKGVEFRTSENRCEIWTLEIKYAIDVKDYYGEKKDRGPADFECFTYDRGCATKINIRPRDEGGSCENRCSSNHRCCPESNRCVPDALDCNTPQKDCIGACAKGWNCCIAQGNQCLKHPIPDKNDLCTCTA